MSTQSNDASAIHVSDLAWGITPTEEVVLRVFVSGPSYGAEIVKTVASSSNYCFSFDESYAYRMLKKLERKGLIEFDSYQVGGSIRKHHRQVTYRITAIGLEVVRCRDEFLQNLSKDRLVLDEEVAVT